jgi:hypothetical protein
MDDPFPPVLLSVVRLGPQDMDAYAPAPELEIDPKLVPARSVGQRPFWVRPSDKYQSQEIDVDD